MGHDRSALPGIPGDAPARHVGRRQVLGAAAATGAAATAAVPGSASAATAVVKKVAQQVPLAWTYNPRTRVTTVTKFRTRTITARFVGAAVSVKSSRGTWVRIPYVWNAKRKALVFSRYLQLSLAPKPKPTPPPVDPPSPTPYVAASQARHVLNRAGYGVSTAGLAAVKAAGGPAAWLEKQLAPASIDDHVCDGVLARWPAQSEPIWAVRDAINRDQRSGWDQLMSVPRQHLVRAMFSQRQLLTVMEEFWANHFNVTVPHDNTTESRAHFQWRLRTNSLGRFSTLLREATYHPAMLTYLNNRDSDASHPNENQGRELLELHTLGVDAGYTEDDVLSAARALTGLSVEDESGEYLYKPWRHWTGRVSVHGWSHANATRLGGEAVVDSLLAHLAQHPATAHRLAHKLCVRFIADDPPAALVSKLAAVYLANGTAIAPVLRVLFASAEFRGAQGRKSRRPVESVVATVRLLGLKPEPQGTNGIEALSWMVESIGQPVFGAPYPTGWPDVAAAWSSTAVTLSRWNATRGLVAGWWPDSFPRPALLSVVLPGAWPATHGEAVDRIATSLFGMVLAPAHRAAVLAFAGATAAEPFSADSPMASWRLDEVVALLLDSPYFHQR